MKRTILTLALSLVALFTHAQTLVVDTDGNPLIGAVVMTKDGTPITIVDKDGTMPKVAPENYPLTLRCLGFENLTVESPTARVVMKETSYELNEITVKAGDRPACRVVCYIRETSGMTNEKDTVRVTTQCMADFMLQDDPKAKKLPTWSSPRTLNKTVEQYSSTGKELDKYEIAALTWYGIVCNMKSTKESPLPKELQGKTTGSYTVKSDKTGCDAIISQITPSQFSVFVDGLADYQDHKFSPGILKLLGATADMYEFWGKKTFSYSDDEHYSLHNLLATTYSLRILGRGKLFRTIFSSDTAVDITTYIEVIPVSITYLTREEAKEMKNDKTATYPMTIPSAGATNAAGR